MMVTKVEMTQAKQRFAIAVTSAPKDMVLDPNTWLLMDPPQVVRR